MGTLFAPSAKRTTFRAPAHEKLREKQVKKQPPRRAENASKSMNVERKWLQNRSKIAPGGSRKAKETQRDAKSRPRETKNYQKAPQEHPKSVPRAISAKIQAHRRVSGRAVALPPSLGTLPLCFANSIRTSSCCALSVTWVSTGTESAKRTTEREQGISRQDALEGARASCLASPHLRFGVGLASLCFAA